MKFTLKLDKTDYLAFNRFTITQLPFTKKDKWISILYNVIDGALFGCVLLVLYKLYDSKYNDESFLLNLLSAILAAVFILGRLWRYYSKKIYSKALLNDNGSILRQRNFEILESGIKQEDEFGSGHYTWKAFMSLQEDSHSLYLFIDNAMALVFPKHKITPEIETLIRQNMSRSQNT